MIVCGPLPLMCVGPEGDGSPPNYEARQPRMKSDERIVGALGERRNPDRICPGRPLVTGDVRALLVACAQDVSHAAHDLTMRGRRESLYQ